MKRIIDGKRYDTETAKLLAEWTNNYYSSDFQWCHEELYVTKKGSYFLYGEGGAMSKYSVPIGNNGSGGGERIKPLSTAEARNWCERSDNNEALEAHFASEIEDA